MELSERSKAMNEGRTEIYLNNPVQQKPNCVLKYLSVKNYQGIKSLIIDNLPNDAQWIFLTGENGFGKTATKMCEKTYAPDIPNTIGPKMF